MDSRYFIFSADKENKVSIAINFERKSTNNIVDN